jgi:hypothetical protein
MRFAFYNRLTTEEQEDPEQASRCRALIESRTTNHPDANATTYLDKDDRESPYHRADQPEPAQETPIP